MQCNRLQLVKASQRWSYCHPNRIYQAHVANTCRVFGRRNAATALYPVAKAAILMPWEARITINSGIDCTIRYPKGAIATTFHTSISKTSLRLCWSAKRPTKERNSNVLIANSPSSLFVALRRHPQSGSLSVNEAKLDQKIIDLHQINLQVAP